MHWIRLAAMTQLQKGIIFIFFSKTNSAFQINSNDSFSLNGIVVDVIVEFVHFDDFLLFKIYALHQKEHFSHPNNIHLIDFLFSIKNALPNMIRDERPFSSESNTLINQRYRHHRLLFESLIHHPIHTKYITLFILKNYFTIFCQIDVFFENIRFIIEIIQTIT